MIQERAVMLCKIFSTYFSHMKLQTWALNLIGKQCPTEILFCGGDHWSPPFHMRDLQELQQQGRIPMTVHCTYLENLRHDFVVKPNMVAVVRSYCLEKIRAAIQEEAMLLIANISRL